MTSCNVDKKDSVEQNLVISEIYPTDHADETHSWRGTLGFV